MYMSAGEKENRDLKGSRRRNAAEICLVVNTNQIASIFNQRERERLPYNETDSFNNLKLESTTCFTDAWTQEDRVGPAPTILPCESRRKPCRILTYEAMFSSRALTSGVSPLQSIPAAL